MNNELIVYEQACKAVAEARTAAEAMELAGKSDAVRVYAQRAQNRELECDAAEIRIRAERRLGEILIEEKRLGRLAEGRPPGNGNHEEPFRSNLAEMGVGKALSSRGQALAGLSPAEFSQSLHRWREDVAKVGARVTVNLLREREKAERREQFKARTEDGCSIADLDALISDNLKFGAILADPPWHFQTYSAKGEDRAAPYRTDPLREIAALPVPALAAKDCVLFLWCVAPMLREALDLIDHWTFDPKTVAFTWMKQNPSGEGLFIGNGYWTRANAEFCLLATRGAPMRLDNGVPQAILTPVREHSRKPDETHERIERLVGGPYLEVYARRPRPGWTTWGNEISREDFAAPDEAFEAAAVQRYAADRSAKWSEHDVQRVREAAGRGLLTEEIETATGIPRGAVKGLARRNAIPLLSGSEAIRRRLALTRAARATTAAVAFASSTIPPSLPAHDDPTSPATAGELLSTAPDRHR